MKKISKLLVVMLAFVALTLGNVVTTASAAEVKPLFNYFASDLITFDETTGEYTIDGMGGQLPRLSSIDYEQYLLKTDYSDDVIKFDYKFNEKQPSLAGEDWCAYFTFRNFSGEAPIWVADYAAYLIFWNNFVELRVYYSNGDQMQFVDETGAPIEAKIDYPSVTGMNIDEEIVVIDKEYHSIEININDETGDITVWRDKGKDNEGIISVSTLTNKGKIGLLETGGYSFSTNKCSLTFKNLYFEDPDKAEVDDEKGKYDEAQKAPQDTATDSENNGTNVGASAKKGCKSSVYATLMLAIPAVAFASYTLKKKEN